jgi:hypothetical protein
MAHAMLTKKKNRPKMNSFNSYRLRVDAHDNQASLWSIAFVATSLPFSA